MLSYLKVKNFAIIDQLEIDFQSGLNVLTGETGAGKSILIKALGLLLGDRASAESIRSGEKESEVQAVFILSNDQINKLKPYNLLEEKDNQLVIRRIISTTGSNKIFINGNVVSLSSLKEVTGMILDICGQHEHQNLTELDNQLSILDSYGKNEKILSQIEELFFQIKNIDEELEKLDIDPQIRNQRIDYLSYQINEIKEINPLESEEEELEIKSQKLAGIKDLGELCQEITESFYGENFSVISTLEYVLKKIKHAQRFDKDLIELESNLSKAIEDLENIGDFFNRYAKKMNLDDGEINKIVDRIEDIKRLKKKFGGSVKEIISKKQEMEKELKDLKNLDKAKEDLYIQREDVVKKYKLLADKVHEARVKAALDISKKVTKELQELNMKGSNFNVQVVKNKEIRIKGMDSVNFLITPNKGEEEKPLLKIASGGELSRVMLAITRILTQNSLIGVYVFDEVDAGIGGDTGKIIGEKLKQVGLNHQVICITHLPQVAVFGHNHLVIEKKEVNKRTVSQIKTLDSPEEKVLEIARMLGGDLAKSESKKHAQAMIAEASKIK